MIKVSLTARKVMYLSAIMAVTPVLLVGELVAVLLRKY